MTDALRQRIRQCRRDKSAEPTGKAMVFISAQQTPTPASDSHTPSSGCPSSELHRLILAAAWLIRGAFGCSDKPKPTFARFRQFRSRIALQTGSGNEKSPRRKEKVIDAGG
jgi:hypothetical protein